MALCGGEHEAQNNSGKVVAPKRWLGKAYSNYNMSDVTLTVG